MKLVGKNIERDGTGHVTFIPQEPEDLWAIYQLISVGDRMQSKTVRKVSKESASGMVDTKKVKLTLTLEVINVEYNPGAASIRVSGKNVVENAHVKLGAHHTVELDINRKFTLYKASWDSIALEQVNEACDPTRSAEVAAVVLEEGLAHVCIITKSMTLIQQKIEKAIPGKRKGDASKHDASMQSFFAAIMAAMDNHLNFDVLKAVIIASPGFTNTALFSYIFEEARKRNVRKFIDNRDKFLIAHASSGHKQALVEVLASKEVQARLENTKTARDTAALEEFFDKLRDDRSCYGFKHVQLCNEMRVIETLLITDELFRAASLPVRKQYVELVEAVRANGGRVVILSVNHVSGESLQRHTGIAAILRQPVALDDFVSTDDDDDDDEGLSVASSSAATSSPVASSSTD